MSGTGKTPKKAMDRATVDPKETAKIVVAASVASTSPPTDAGSKTSTPVRQTPNKRTKRKNSRFSLGEKLFAPLIAAHFVDSKLEDKAK